MKNERIKNIEFSNVLELDGLVNYQEGQVVSKTLSQNKAVSVTVFAFDKDEEISTHISEGDAMVYVIDGSSEITVGEEKFRVSKGQTIVMPSGKPHGLYAVERFKMLLVVVF